MTLKTCYCSFRNTLLGPIYVESKKHPILGRMTSLATPLLKLWILKKHAPVTIET
jgi:hypothetical protein